MDGSPLVEPQSAIVAIVDPPANGSIGAGRGAPPLSVPLPEEPLPEGPLLEEPLVGVVLGERYRIDELIGAGGMGLVYRATHTSIGRALAVKVLRRRYATDPDVAQRFAQEARVASSVKHPNVVDIIDYGFTTHGTPYCVMELLVGRSLAREIVDRGPLEPGRAIAIGVAIARGLAAAHRGGIIHRDLKPDNVFLATDEQAAEQVKILDFGIARILDRKTRLTADGAVVGTPEYMSPEQARDEDLDPRSDLYALGVLLFEALSGQVPLQGDTLVGTLTKQVFELPPLLRTIDPRFAAYPSIEAALVRLLAKNREERPATALDAVRLLETAAQNDLKPTTPAHEQAAVSGWLQPEPQADRPRRSTIMIGSGAITSAHQAAAADGPATGSFAAKQGESARLEKRPSVIVTDGPAGQVRPVRVYQATPGSMASASPYRAAASQTPVPRRADRALGKRASGVLRRRHVPLILLGLGAAIVAALVTIGFVRWLQGSDDRANVTGDGTGRRGGCEGFIHEFPGLIELGARGEPRHGLLGEDRRGTACSTKMR